MFHSQGEELIPQSMVLVKRWGMELGEKVKGQEMN
jgi:hypothetical protein